MKRLYTKTSGPVVLLRNVFLKTCANTTSSTILYMKYCTSNVVCMVNKAASYSTMLYPTILLSHPFSTPSHFASHFFNLAISITAPRRWNNDLPPELCTISLPSPPLMPITIHHLHPAPLSITPPAIHSKLKFHLFKNPD